jgi:predicted amidohydrolase
MNQTFRAACVQMRTGVDVSENLRSAEALIREAHGRGAAFVATPEVTVLFEAESDRLFAQVHTEEDDPSLRRLRALAQELGVWLLIGSMAIKVGDRQCANRSFLIGPGGQVVATYDK